MDNKFKDEFHIVKTQEMLLLSLIIAYASSQYIVPEDQFDGLCPMIPEFKIGTNNDPDQDEDGKTYPTAWVVPIKDLENTIAVSINHSLYLQYMLLCAGSNIPLHYLKQMKHYGGNHVCVTMTITDPDLVAAAKKFFKW